jgi:hypothetical protein
MGSGGPSSERVRAIRPVLERAATEGVTQVEDGGYTWRYRPLDPDPLTAFPDDERVPVHPRLPTRRRGCGCSVIPWLVLAVVALWRLV